MKTLNINCDRLIGKELYLFDNKLITISYSIDNLIDLQILYVNYNNLTFIHDSTDNLINLQELYLYHNDLIYIPNLSVFKFME